MEDAEDCKSESRRVQFGYIWSSGSNISDGGITKGTPGRGDSLLKFGGSTNVIGDMYCGGV